jgi:AcrR family transcriptional regulator
MGQRPYVSPVRAAAAQAKRAEVIAAAAEFLRQEPLTAFSLDAVARAARVTRLTVYNQFGSRRGLLEAVFDHLAEQGRLARIGEAVTDPQPPRGVSRLVEVFCDFWSSDRAIGRLHDAMASDPELAQALAERNARRREAVAALLERIPLPAADASRRRDAIDMVFALTSYPMFRLLAEGRSSADTCALLQAACAGALARMTSPG